MLLKRIEGQFIDIDGLNQREMALTLPTMKVGRMFVWTRVMHISQHLVFEPDMSQAASKITCFFLLSSSAMVWGNVVGGMLRKWEDEPGRLPPGLSPMACPSRFLGVGDIGITLQHLLLGLWTQAPSKGECDMRGSYDEAAANDKQVVKLT